MTDHTDPTPPTQQASSAQPGDSGRIGRFVPLMVLIVVLMAIWLSGAWRHLSLETLREQRQALSAMVAARPILSILIYIVLYTTITALMLPGALWVTIAGGFLFGLTGGLLATVLGATLGATILFAVARTSLGETLRVRAGPFLARLRAGFEDNALSVMFAMRFMPAVPFPVANIAPALLGARMRDFLLTTAIGITPGAAAYAWIGSGLGASFDRGVVPDLTSFGANLFPAFLMLAVVSLLPMVYRYAIRARRKADD